MVSWLNDNNDNNDNYNNHNININRWGRLIEDILLINRCLYSFRFLEITAANKANVCTYAVLGPRKVQQPVRIIPFDV